MGALVLDPFPKGRSYLPILYEHGTLKRPLAGKIPLWGKVSRFSKWINLESLSYDVIAPYFIKTIY